MDFRSGSIAAATRPDWDTNRRGQRRAALFAVGLVHALIAVAWLAQRPLLSIERGEAPRMVWLDIPSPLRAVPPKTVAEPALPPARRRSSLPVPVPVPEPVPEPVPVAPSASDLPAAAPPAAEPPAVAAPSAADLLANARRMAGSVDKQLRKESHKQIEFVDTPYKRFLSDLEAAYVPQWSGIATVTEITVPGTGERLAKISNGSRSYCIHIPSPSMGIDAYESARRNPKVTDCPR
jgi:hypothetical protein